MSGSDLDVGRAGVVVVVASLGGLTATPAVLAALPAGFPVAVVVVQHGRRADDHLDRLPRVLQRGCALPVRIARDGGGLSVPGVTVVPPGLIAEVHPGGSPAATGDAAPPRIRLRAAAERESRRPGDVLLTSVAAVFGRAVVAAVLTGMLRDGTEGVQAVKSRGGWVLAQDPATARARGMPSSAIATGCVDLVLPIERIGPAIVALATGAGTPDLGAAPPPPGAPRPA